MKLATRFWPGPLTLVLRRAPDVGSQLTGGQDTIGLRIPGHPVALQLLREFGGGIAAPSANRFGRISPTTAEHVRTDLGSEVELVLDGGACEIGIESTIVDLSRGRPMLLRPGRIGAGEIAATLGVALSVGAGNMLYTNGVPDVVGAFPRAAGHASIARQFADSVQPLWIDGAAVRKVPEEKRPDARG